VKYPSITTITLSQPVEVQFNTGINKLGRLLAVRPVIGVVVPPPAGNTTACTLVTVNAPVGTVMASVAARLADVVVIP
jgi:hypothetical protein